MKVAFYFDTFHTFEIKKGERGNAGTKPSFYHYYPLMGVYRTNVTYNNTYDHTGPIFRKNFRFYQNWNLPKNVEIQQNEPKMAQNRKEKFWKFLAQPDPVCSRQNYSL